MRLTFHVSPRLDDLGPLPMDAGLRVVQYQVTVGEDVRVHEVRYDLPLHTDVDAPGYEPIQVRVRWPWSSDERYREFQDVPGVGRS